ncbi:MAG TPA: DnaD domain protein [Anaerolineales bacterium]|nr:DnaD domain protein [Anaerolineales bacterium]
MGKFRGFEEGKIRFTSIPDLFFSDLLPQINHLGELKVAVYTFWRLKQMEGVFRYMRQAHFLEDPDFMTGMGATPQEAEEYLIESLDRCVQRGALLRATLIVEDREESFYFLNSPKGRAAVEAIAQGEWRPSGDRMAPVQVTPAHPNVFRLYEENIGPLTPMIAEALRDAENTYPASWIEEAIRIAVDNNVRRWNYVEAILDRWQKEGHHGREDRRDTEKDRRKYVEGEFSDYIEH